MRGFLRYHLHVVLYAYFWLGLFLCGLLAPDWRVRELDSGLIGKGWHLSALSVALLLPVPVAYILRMRQRGPRQGEHSEAAGSRD
jgi:hypothetical protein